MNKDWEFISKGTEITLGKFVPEYFTPLTLNLQTGVVSTEDTGEIWVDWVINRKMKKIILLEFKRKNDLRESYFQD